eukprot:12812942-Alexandrium_andersonii.AAC.1
MRASEFAAFREGTAALSVPQASGIHSRFQEEAIAPAREPTLRHVRSQLPAFPISAAAKRRAARRG